MVFTETKDEEQTSDLEQIIPQLLNVYYCDLSSFWPAK